MPTPLIDTAVAAQRQAVIAQLVQIGDLRPGSLVERIKRCGNPNTNALSGVPAAMARNGS